MKKNPFFPLYFVLFMDNFGFSLVFVLFAPLIMNPEFGMVAEYVPLASKNFILASLFAVFPLTQFFGAPFLGDVGDQYGRKKALYITIAGSLAGYILSALAISAHSLLILIISRLITGFFAGNASICLASIADLSPTEESRAKRFGFVTIIWGIAWSIGIFLGGVISDPTVSTRFSPALPFWITGLLTALSYLAVWKLYEDTHVTGDHSKLNILEGVNHVISALKIRSTRLLYLVYFLWMAGWCGIAVQWFAPYAMRVFGESQSQTAYGLILNGTMWMIAAAFLNPLLLKRYKSSKIIIWSLLLTSILLMAMGFKNQMSFNLFFGFASFFAAPSLINLLTVISVASPADIQGKVMGFTQSMMALATFSLPFFSGIVATKMISAMFPIAGVLMLATMLVLIIWVKKNEGLLNE